MILLNYNIIAWNFYFKQVQSVLFPFELDFETIWIFAWNVL